MAISMKKMRAWRSGCGRGNDVRMMDACGESGGRGGSLTMRP